MLGSGGEAGKRRWLAALGLNGPTVRDTFALLRELPKVSVGLTSATALLTVLGAVLPNLFTVATGVVIAAVPAATRDGTDSPAGRRLLLLTAGAAVLYVLPAVLATIQALVQQPLGRRLDMHMADRVMAATLRPPGIGHLEDSAVLDRISQARGVGPGQVGPAMALRGLVNLGGVRLRAIGAAAILAAYAWWLAIALLVFRILIRRQVIRQMQKSLAFVMGQTEALRETHYLRELATTAAAAKETRVFGTRHWLVDRFRTRWLATMEEAWKERRQGIRDVLLGSFWVMAADLAAYGLLAWSATRGDISVGELVVYAGAVMGIAAYGQMGNDEHLIRQGSAAVPAAAEVERATADVEVAGSQPADGLPQQSIRFEGVRFAYPGSHRAVYEDLDLEIPAGRSLAIVGSNGAGKTTLVKLLARLYEPTDGRITADGIDLRQLDVASWRGQVAALFQDFVHYDLAAVDNVAFGAPDRPLDAGALDDAARRAGATETIAALPAGWDTPLSRTYEGGADLSGGQWQRVALARAFYAVQAGATVLVLDEPTANLDVRAEADIFERFLDMTRGLTTVLISHRFSTVRRADLICVLDAGKVVERGTHDELMALDGHYARLFNLQASRFVEAAE